MVYNVQYETPDLNPVNDIYMYQSLNDTCTCSVLLLSVTYPFVCSRGLKGVWVLWVWHDSILSIVVLVWMLVTFCFIHVVGLLSPWWTTYTVKCIMYTLLFSFCSWCHYKWVFRVKNDPFSSCLPLLTFPYDLF